MSTKRYRALYQFAATAASELSCNVGDEFIGLGDEQGGWIQVRLVSGAGAGGRTSGLVPFAYLVPVKEDQLRTPPPPPVSLPTGAEKRFKVLYDFTASNPAEISCKTGDVVMATGEPQQGWISVKVVGRASAGAVNITGLVPLNYLSETPSVPVRSVPVKPVQAPSSPPQTNVAVEHAECAICYDEMVSKPVVILLNASKKRPCRHFLHKDCAEGLLRTNQKTCPICRAPFVSVYPLPSFDANPKLWFECVDVNGDKTLSKVEVVEVLKATMAIDYRALEKNVDSLWPRWDKDGSGEIDFSELCDPKIGLLVYCRSHFARKKREPPPELTRGSLEVWYQYWDEDDNGSLNKEEIIRALVKTFKLSATPAKIKELRESVDVVWSLFDGDNSGEVDLHEFIARDGLGESLCASLSFTR